MVGGCRPPSALASQRCGASARSAKVESVERTTYGRCRDGFVVNMILPDRVSLGSLHDFAPRIRRTEVRPICTRRAISDWLTPARYSFRISGACRMTLAGRHSRSAVQPCIGQARPTSFPQNLPFEFGECASKPAIARPSNAALIKTVTSLVACKPFEFNHDRFIR